MNILTEYMYCFINISCLTYCVYEYFEYKKTILKIGLFLLVTAFVDLLITEDYVFHMEVFILITVTSVAASFLMFCILYNKKSYYLFFYIINYQILSIYTINAITYILETMEISVQATMLNPFYRLFMVIAFNTTSVALYALLKKTKCIPKRNLVKENCLLFTLINVISYSIPLLFFGLRVTGEISTYSLIIIISCFVLWLVLLYSLTKSFHNLKENSEMAIYENLYAGVQQHVLTYEKESNRLSKIQHDVKNHFILLNVLSNEPKVKAYIRKIYEEIEDLTIMDEINSGNTFVDAIIQTAKQKYEKVSFIYSFSIKDLKINEKDLSSLLFNLVDNAAEAASKSNGSVKIKMESDQYRLFIKIQNDIVEKTDFVSKKGKGHGYGMNIINEIVDKYQGNKSIIIEVNQVVCTIILNLNRMNG